MSSSFPSGEGHGSGVPDGGAGVLGLDEWQSTALYSFLLVLIGCAALLLGEHFCAPDEKKVSRFSRQWGLWGISQNVSPPILSLMV